ncbi:MAG: hypothetical protein OEV36_08140 [Myxococcales bacterium]|nr:hypothetical protein [Myxococcales bacterium]
MSNVRENIGPSSTKRRIAAAIALLGVLLVGSQLARAWPRNVSIRYAVEPDVTRVEVDYLQKGRAVASVRFRQLDGRTRLIRHAVRLQPGVYEVRITLYRSGDRREGLVRELAIPTDGLVRFDLASPARSPE